MQPEEPTKRKPVRAENAGQLPSGAEGLAGGVDAGRSFDDGHYVLDVVGARLGLPGGGLHVYFTGDLLHPPMVQNLDIWSDGRRWKQGAVAHTLAIGELAELRPGERLLDIGCGLGGPARLLARQFGVTVTSVTNSSAHAATCRRLNAQEPDWNQQITTVLADCRRELPEGPFDAAVSINMLYQVSDHRALFERVFSRLAPGGRFVIDDWMLTSRATATELDLLASHFSYAYFAHVERIEDDLLAAGFPPIEKVVDLGRVARGPMTEHFERQIQSYFAPQIITDWPGDPEEHPGQPAYGRLMVEEFVAAVKATLELYRNRSMTYRRLLVRKPEPPRGGSS